MGRQCTDCSRCSLWHRSRLWCAKYKHPAAGDFGCRGGIALHPRMKLSRDQVREMRRLRRVERMSLRMLAARFQVHHVTVRNVVLGYTHKDENTEVK